MPPKEEIVESFVLLDPALISPPEFEGYLFKQSYSGRKTFAKRWFELRKYRLVYQQSNTESIPKAVLYLENATLQMETKMGKQFGFVIAGPNLPGPLHLAAESEEELLNWVHALSARVRIKMNMEEDQDMQLKMMASIASNVPRKSEETSSQASPFSPYVVIDQLSSVKYTRTCDESQKDRHRNNYTLQIYQQASRWEALLTAPSLRPLEGGRVSTEAAGMDKRTVKELRQLIHGGVPHRWRSSLWFALSGGQKLSLERPNLYSHAYTATFSTTYTDDAAIFDPSMVPLFGAEHFPLASCCLSPTGIKQAKVILCLLAQQNVEMDFCPALPNLVCILLMYLTGPEAFATATAMVTASRLDEHDRTTKDLKRWYLGTSRRRHCLLLRTFCTTAQKLFPKLYAHLEHIGIRLAHIANEWFATLFHPALPFPTALRLFDAYIAEGRKTLYRAGLGLLRLLEPELLKEDDSAKAEQLIRAFTSNCTNEPRLFAGLFEFPVPTESLYQCDVGHIALGDLANPALVFPHPQSIPFGELYYRPTLSDLSQILTTFTQWELAYSWIPQPYCTRNPVLAYASYLHGASLATLYHSCAPKAVTGYSSGGAPALGNEAGSLLLIEAIGRGEGAVPNVFGAFVPDRLVLGHGADYFVTRHTRLFEFRPNEALFPAEEDVEGQHLKRYVIRRQQGLPLPSWYTRPEPAEEPGDDPVTRTESAPAVMIAPRHHSPEPQMHKAKTMAQLESQRQGTVQALADHLAIGHTGSPSAILLHRDAQTGRSAACPRFDNPVFCGGDFTILKLEVYLLPL